jgi:hypothetical protein
MRNEPRVLCRYKNSLSASCSSAVGWFVDNESAEGYLTAPAEQLLSVGFKMPPAAKPRNASAHVAVLDEYIAKGATVLDREGKEAILARLRAHQQRVGGAPSERAHLSRSNSERSWPN